ncbi:MAG: hypothetical protein CVT83_01435 [Alphaproteobacteria bacterium HGW-Alphaproteobacteria-5]|nr:MAG: hypothetical protein CVT83_01435 [Alphaproteobacteria bacterium HGW-Alphaproteobacteria-5]
MNNLSLHVAFWVSAIALLAFVQIILGQSHPINQFSAGDGIVEFRGAGNIYFTVLGIPVFRPTSIFFHTGKFGQTIFFLFLVAFALYQMRPGRASRVALFVSLMGIAISGQRASMAAALIILAAYLILINPRMALRTGRIMAILAPIAVVLMISSDAPAKILDGISYRFISIFGSGSSRFVANSLNWGAALDAAGMFGAGVGSYSLGSKMLGGGTFLLGENSWMRFVVEWGVLGSAAILVIIVASLLPKRRSRGGDPGLIFVNIVLPTLLVIVWCFTHDVLANYLSVAYFALYIGLAGSISFRRSSRRRHSRAGRVPASPHPARSGAVTPNRIGY